MNLVRLQPLKNLVKWRSLSLFEKKFSCTSMIVRSFYCGDRCLPLCYFGIRVGKRVGGAVKRNFLRRRIRNIAQENLKNSGLHFSCVYLISVLPSSIGMNFADLKRDFLRASDFLYKKIAVCAQSYAR